MGRYSFWNEVPEEGGEGHKNHPWEIYKSGTLEHVKHVKLYNLKIYSINQILNKN